MAELQLPLPHRLIADHGVTRSQQFIHHLQAEREAEIGLESVADDLSWKAVAGTAGMNRCDNSVRLPRPEPRQQPDGALKVTKPKRHVDGAVARARVATACMLAETRAATP